MATYIRLTDYKSSDEKEQGFFNPENRYEAKQEDFEKIPGSPIVYWVNNKVFDIFQHKPINSNLTVCAGLSTTDNELFLRLWSEINFNDFALKIANANECILSGKRWFPFLKGGEYKKWYGNNEYVLNWKNNGEDLRNYIAANPAKQVGGRIINEEYYFLEGSSWGVISSSSLSCRYSEKGHIISNATGGLFSNNINYVLYGTVLLNSKIAKLIFPIINPTINYSAGTVAKLPIIFPKQDSTMQQIEILVQQNIDISKEEWDSRETSWDFEASPLLMDNGELRIENGKIEDAYNKYCSYWREKFFILHKNEEELNRLFIEIYGLEDELTSDVALKDITILKNEAKIVDDELVFQREEIMKQFISYGVGVMFGRYSLDHKGLHVANMNESLEQANSKFNIQNPTFEADDDNVIPVLEDDYFKDDIASRFVQFVKATFGEENLSQNLRFIESSLGTTLRKYFVKGFYEDHIKRYKKRPIYWMVASPKKGFMSLIYMHRYEADTFARVRNSYLTEYIAKLEVHKETLALTTTSDTASNKDKKDADKQMKNIDTKLKEIIEFDRDKMMSWSQNPTEIDLDDGVKVNYCQFKDILYPITGLCKK